MVAQGLLVSPCRYERRYIQRWLAGGNRTCPASGQTLTLPATLTPNVALRKSIEAWAEKYALWLLVSPGFWSARLSHLHAITMVPAALHYRPPCQQRLAAMALL